MKKTGLLIAACAALAGPAAQAATNYAEHPEANAVLEVVRERGLDVDRAR